MRLRQLQSQRLPKRGQISWSSGRFKKEWFKLLKYNLFGNLTTYLTSIFVYEQQLIYSYVIVGNLIMNVIVKKILHHIITTFCVVVVVVSCCFV
jgi:hypothetical protein